MRKPHNWVQLGKFLMVGLSGYVVNLAVFTLSIEVLGVHHDAVVSIGLLRGQAADERDPGRIAAYVLLFDVETTARDRALVRFETAWPQLEPHFRPR